MKALIFSLISFTLASTLMISLAAPVAAQADQIEGNGVTWIQEIKAAIQAKNQTYSEIDLTGNVLPTPVRVRLEAIAGNQAQIWGDTILEGDYIAEQDVKMDKVEAVHSSSKFLGYRITYSSVGYEISDCNPKKNLAECAPGRIVEASFVAPDLANWTRDEAALVEFVAR